MAETTNDLNSLTKSLGADFPVLPVSKGKKPVSSQEYSDTLIKIAPEKIKAIEAMGTAEQKQKEIQAGGKRKVTEDYAKVAHEDTEKYDKEFEKLKQPEFAPTKENAQSLGELFSLVATMGVMLGGSGKMAAQGAMDAMTGMLKGWQSGRKDLYERQLKEYDKETKRIDSERTALTNKLSRLSQLRLIDKEAAYALQAEIEAQFPGVIAATVRNQSIDVVYKMVESLQKQATSREEKEESLKLRRDIAAMKSSVGGGGRKEKDLKKGETVAQNMSEVIGQKIDIDTAAKIAATHDFTRKLQDLKTTNVKLGNVSGIAVNFSNQINQFLTRKVGENGYITQALMDEAKTNLDSDKSFQGLSDKSKIMAKKELDTVMSYLQTKYGNRAPVAEFRAANSVLSRKSSSATSYNAILDNEITAANQRLAPLVNPKQAKSIYDYLDKNADEITNILNPEKTSDLENLLKQNNLPYEPNKFDYMILDGVVHSKLKAKVQ